MNVTDKICSDCCVYTHSKIQIIISHLLALLAAQILPRHAPGLLFNVSITTGEGNCVLLQLYLVNKSLLFFFPLRKPHSTQHNFPGSWKCREMVWSGPVCVNLNMGCMAALLWQTQSKAVCFFQTSGKYTVPSRGNIYIHFLFLSIYVFSLFLSLFPSLYILFLSLYVFCLYSLSWVGLIFLTSESPL